MMDRNYLLLLLCFLVFSGAENIETDQSALLSLKSSMDDSSSHLLSNWTEGTSVCSWIGVECSSLHNRVVALNVSFLDLGGTISPHIGNISFLTSLDINGNHFHGQLPVEIARLTRLAYFSFNSNSISGEIPGWFGSLPDLLYLDLRNNSFSGSLPSSLFNATKLEILDLSSNHLSGYIPDEVGDLVNLKILALEYNLFEGFLPPSIFNLSSLQFMALTDNRLNGQLPLDICTKLPKLARLHLSYNRLSGQVQSRFDNCSQFQRLSLSYNNFTGPIPREICNLTRLVRLDGGSNGFQGQIPTAIGDLRMLSLLDLSSNFLSGPIPPSIFNLSSLSAITLVLNNLTGILPLHIGQQLPNLENLNLGGNKLSGVIPNSISNLTRLIYFEIAQNQFTGSLPTSLGNLRFLQRLSVGSNFFITDSTMEFDFLASLAGCTSLTMLNVAANPLNIPLSPSIGNLSSSLTSFYALFCGMSGHVPHEIGNLSGLIKLNLAYNNFTGLLPPRIRNLINLQGLVLEGNQITGLIPNSFCNMRQLSILNLGRNQFYGQVPECFWSMTSLRDLVLNNNALNSTLPAELAILRDLLTLDVHSNFLSGNITPAIGTLRAIVCLDLSENKFSGSIPQSIGGLSNLIWLYLAHNELQGTIPKEFRNLLSLEILDLSNNNLTGEIPATLEKLSELKYFNVSFNHLRGRIPANGSFMNFTSESFMSNDALCGGISDLHFPPCIANSSKKGSRRKTLQLVAYILIPTGALVCLLSGILFLLMKKQQKIIRTLPQVALASSTSHKRVSFFEIQRATNCFSESNLLGTGGYGQVYKGVLRDGTVLAIKVFNLQLEAAFRSFETECEVISSIRHRNLVKIISTCSTLDFKALVLEYMPNGSLDKWLYSHNHFLGFSQRLDIMIDVASALDYLHCSYTTPIVHCDLKPSNILLDEQMTGRLTDFGISKLLGRGENMVQTMTVATIGYTAPEYGSEGLVSTSCDIYSFGILLMETFTRRKPTDEMFGEEWGLKEMIMNGLQNSTIDFIDQNLLIPEEKISNIKVRCILSLMELALNCAEVSSEKRFHASSVLAELQKIKLIFLSNSERISNEYLHKN